MPASKVSGVAANYCLINRETAVPFSVTILNKYKPGLRAETSTSNEDEFDVQLAGWVLPSMLMIWMEVKRCGSSKDPVIDDDVGLGQNVKPDVPSRLLIDAVKNSSPSRMPVVSEPLMYPRNSPIRWYSNF